LAQFPEWAKIVPNFETLTTPTTKKFTVPAGKQWLVYGGYFERDVNATMDIEAYDSDDHAIYRFKDQYGAGTTNLSWGADFPVPLSAGMYVQYTWGAQQTSPEVSCLVSEYPTS
jgi:hypothetical protein